MSPVALLVWLWACASLCGCGPAPSEAADELRWHASLAGARADAERRGLPLLVHFAAPGRPLSAEMDAVTLPDRRVVAAIRDGFVAVRTDATAEPSLFRRTVGARAGLASCAVTADGAVVGVHVGYASPRGFRGFLRDVRGAAPAIAACRAALAAGPDDHPARLRLGGLLLRTGCRLDAEVELTRVAADLADAAAPAERALAARACARLARIAAERGEPDAALRLITLALARDADGAFGTHPELAFTAGKVAIIERRMTDAARDLAALLARWPVHAEAAAVHCDLGLAQHECGDDRRAVATLGRVLDGHPGSTWAERARDTLEHIRREDHGHTH